MLIGETVTINDGTHCKRAHITDSQNPVLDLVRPSKVVYNGYCATGRLNRAITLINLTDESVIKNRESGFSGKLY